MVLHKHYSCREVYRDSLPREVRRVSLPACVAAWRCGKAKNRGGFSGFTNPVPHVPQMSMGQLWHDLGQGGVRSSPLPKPLRASPDSKPRLHAGVAPIANRPPLVIRPRTALDALLVPLASLANRLPVCWGLDLRADAPACDSAQMRRDFEEVLHKAKSPQIGGCVKVLVAACYSCFVTRYPLQTAETAAFSFAR